MRNLKKVLALVLALVMALSLVTIANAADFSDSADINYDEAIDVMVAAGIIDGVGGNKFDPKGTLTREQAAKLITYMLMGDNSENLGIESSSFKDVAVTRWSAPAIEYCATMGIIDGAGDGNFYPAGKLTGYAFAKMLLTAIGYDSDIERFVGNGWTINVASIGMEVGLNKGMDKMFGSAELTREEAAQMALNALKTPLVEYENRANITVNGAEVSFGTQKASYVTTTIAEQQNISNEKLTNTDENIQGGYTVEFAEKYLPKLVLRSEPDAFGRPAHIWRYDGELIGKYVDEADLTYTTTVKSGDIYKDLNLSETVPASDTVVGSVTVPGVKIIVDGEETEIDSAFLGDAKRQYDTAAVAKGGDVKLGGNGVLTQVFKSIDRVSGKVDLTITVIHTYVGRVSSIIPATSNAERKIRLSYITPANTRAEAYKASGVSSAVSDLRYETDDFVVGDLVCFNMASDNGASTHTFAPENVQKLEVTATGKLTAFSGSNLDDSGSTFTAGEKYKYNPKAGFESGYTKVQDFDMKSELDIYCDEYGYALYVEASELAKNYAVVIGVGSSNIYGDNTGGATLLLADGTKVQVTYKMADGSTLSTPHLFNGKVNFVGDLVTYTVGSDNVYTLTQIAGGTGKYIPQATGEAQDQNTVDFTNGKSYIGIESNKLYTTSETVFFVRTGDMDDSDDWTYNVYTGYAAAPTMDSDGADTDGVTYATNKAFSNQVDAVFVAIESAVGGGENTLFVKPDDVEVITEDGVGEAYGILPVIANGEITTMKVAYSLFNKTGPNGGFDLYYDGNYDGNADAQYVLAASYTTNSDGIVTSINAKAPHDAQDVSDPAGMANEYYGALGTVATSRTVVGFGDGTSANSMFWAYAADTKVYFIDSEFETITESTVNGIYDDANDVVEYILDSNTKTVKAIYVFQKDNDPAAFNFTKDAGVLGIYLDRNRSDEVTTGDELVPGTEIYVDVTHDAALTTSVVSGVSPVGAAGDLLTSAVAGDLYKFVFNGSSVSVAFATGGGGGGGAAEEVDGDSLADDTLGDKLANGPVKIVDNNWAPEAAFTVEDNDLEVELDLDTTNGDVTVDGVTLTIGGDVTGTNGIILTNGATLDVTGTIAGDVTITSGDATVAGAVTGDVALVDGSATLDDVTGDITITDGDLTAGDVNGDVNIDGAGTVQMGAVTAATGVTIDGTGSVEMGAVTGDVSVDGTGTNEIASVDGAVSVATGAAVTVTGAITGNVTTTGTGAVTAESIDFAQTINNAGTITLTGALDLVTAASGAATTLTGGAWVISGAVTADATNALAVDANTDVTLTNVTATAAGGVTVDATGTLTINGTLDDLDYIAGDDGATVVFGANATITAITSVSVEDDSGTAISDPANLKGKTFTWDDTNSKWVQQP